MGKFEKAMNKKIKISIQNGLDEISQDKGLQQSDAITEAGEEGVPGFEAEI